MTKILITIEGGLVTSVVSNREVEVSLVDYDMLETGDAPEDGADLKYDVPEVLPDHQFDLLLQATRKEVADLFAAQEKC